jgi:hypothetical protein
MEWTDFLPHVLPSVVGCSEPLALDHIVQAARVFARKTLCWNYQLPQITSIDQQATYTLPLGIGEELVKVTRCLVDDDLYTPAVGSLGRQYINDGSCSREIAYVEKPNLLTISPVVAAGLAIVVDVAVQPSSDQSGEWPDDLEEFAKDIAAGAISTLCALPKTTWQDLETASAQAMVFRDRIATVFWNTSKGQVRSTKGGTAAFF